MVKRLTAIGNSLGVIIEKPILDLLEIDRNTDLEVKTDGEGLIIRPVRESRAKRIQSSSRRMMDAHDKVLKKLS